LKQNEKERLYAFRPPREQLHQGEIIVP